MVPVIAGVSMMLNGPVVKWLKAVIRFRGMWATGSRFTGGSLIAGQGAGFVQPESDLRLHSEFNLRYCVTGRA